MRTCKRCAGPVPHIAFICPICKDAGWYWDHHKQQVRNRRRLLCVRCETNTILGTNKLCEVCKDKGWQWCAIGQHVVQSTCRACLREQANKWWSRNRAIITPEGYLSLKEAAPLLGYSRATLTWQIRNGHREALRYRGRYFLPVEQRPNGQKEEQDVYHGNEPSNH